VVKNETCTFIISLNEKERTKLIKQYPKLITCLNQTNDKLVN